MRTTLNLPDSLLEAVRRRAQEEGRTITSVVEEALRAALATEAERPEAPLLPAYGSPAERFRVDPADREALWVALDADGAR
jgi:plasmid stability protein